MIGMLRRRLMSNMAKAKNIATGTVTATIESSGAGGLYKRSLLTVSDLNFMPTNVVVVRTEGVLQTTLYIWDSTSYYYASGGFATGVITRSFNANGFVIEATGSLGSPGLFDGTYHYVAWQE